MGVKCCYCGYEGGFFDKHCSACGFPLAYHHPECKCKDKDPNKKIPEHLLRNFYSYGEFSMEDLERWK